MGKSAIKPFNAQTLLDAVKPLIEKAQPYIAQAQPHLNAFWAQVKPHTGRVNTLLHGYEPWQILALASVATLVLMKVLGKLFS